MNDRDDIARHALRAFEHASAQLAKRGVSDLEIGKAMVAAGLSRWSRAVGPAELVEQLAGLTGGIAQAAGIDLASDTGSKSTTH